MKKILAIALSIAFFIAAFTAITPAASADTLPSAYNNNPSSLQYMTSVKDQGDFGVCWAFAAIACCETEAVKNHGVSPDEIDLSELHLAYFGYNGERSTGDNVVAYSPFYQHGGYSQLPIFTLSNWIGLVDESVAPYQSLAQNPSNFSLDSSLMYQNVEYYLENAYSYSLPNDIDKVKEAIMTYGAVQTSYYSDEYYYRSATASHYCPQVWAPNHAVTIVGWDDNYSKANFKSSARPQSNGAWLVKNSWGDDWGCGGYFWLSYEDKTVSSATAYDVTPTSEFNYDNNYQHDGGIALTFSEYAQNSAASIFTAGSNEELLAVSVMTYDTPNADYSLKIYVNPSTLSPSRFNRGTPIHEQSGTLPESGYTTIPLTAAVDLYEGDVFIILIETNAHLALDADHNVMQGSTTLVTSSASVLANQTYFAVDGGGFYDPYAQGGIQFNARIKAFTKNTLLGTAQLQSLPTASSIEYGQSLRDVTLSGGRVNDSISQRIIRGTWSFAEPDTIPKNGDTATIIFTPDNSDYGSIEMPITVSVTQSEPKLTIKTDKSNFKDGDTVGVIATVQNQHSPSLDDLPTMRLYYQIDNGEKIFFTSSFVMPSDIDGSRLTIGVITEEIEGKYESGEKTISFTTPKIELPDITDTEGDNGTDDIITPDATESLPQETDSHPSIEFDDGQILPSIDPFDNERDDNDKATSLFGCLSSAHVSVIFTIATLTGIAIIRKRRYD